MKGEAINKILLITLLIIVPSSQLFAQNQTPSLGDEISQQDELDSPELAIPDEDSENISDQASQQSNAEAIPEVFNPSEEIVDDTPVAFPVDI